MSVATLIGFVTSAPVKRKSSPKPFSGNIFDGPCETAAHARKLAEKANAERVEALLGQIEQAARKGKRILQLERIDTSLVPALRARGFKVSHDDGTVVSITW